MKLQLESNQLEDYLQEIPPVVQFYTPLIQKKISEIKSRASNDHDRAKMAFETARDEIAHNFDTKSDNITVNAEDVLNRKEGICFAKSHLLASLLRGMEIPAGFCYQKVLKKGTVESGYALHGLNAIYLPETGWFRVDPRGNKLGIDSQFSIEEEKLAYPIRPELGEIDYNIVLTKPLATVVHFMQESRNCEQLFNSRPTDL
ncbi:transglutaminase family protein [Aequorivita sp. H23M31]|uniref:Transglutaminase family protein n=1 Tax=Aequorivita ciconiae TaxID=2494375 RepID=A0A410G5Q3_9FLAO|nr:transglutaminase family protein [Aequorivita sp. H23M31]QAA82589.1 transglutaminase family protein [Aequorivita sp. H23M31]